MKKHRWAVLDELDRQNEYLKRLHESFEALQRQAELMQNASGVAAQMMGVSAHIRNITESTALNAIKEITYQRNYWQDIVESPAIKAVELLQRQNEYFRPIISAFNEFQKQERYVNSIIESPAFKTIFISAADLYNRNKLLDIVPQTFAAQIITELGDAFNSIEETTADNLVNSIEEIIEEKCKRLKPNRISFEGMLQIWLALILFIYSIHLSNKTEENLTNRLLQAEQRILKSIEGLKPEESKEVYFVVERTVKIRLKPSTKSPVITILHSNQRVSLINSKGKWIYIEYFDYIEGLPKSGWACKKYLKRLGR